MEVYEDRVSVCGGVSVKDRELKELIVYKVFCIPSNLIFSYKLIFHKDHLKQRTTTSYGSPIFEVNDLLL